MRPLISITIATWNRRDLLQRLIISLENQTIPQWQYEVIVCDSASTDGTGQMIDEMCKNFSNIRHINCSRNTLAHKRNSGIKEARGPIVIFLDDDVIATENFVKTHLEAHLGNSQIVFCGQVRFPEDWVLTSNYFRFRDSRHLGPLRLDIDSENIPYKNIVVMNLSFKRDEIIDRVGNVSEKFEHYGCEDYEFGYRIHQAGIRLKYLPNALLYHHESQGTISRYARKLYVTARYSVPILRSLVPKETQISRYQYLEMLQSPSFSLFRLAVQIVMNPMLASMVKRYLELTDNYRWMYSALLFNYVFAAAYYRGIYEGMNQKQSQAIGSSWFE